MRIFTPAIQQRQQKPSLYSDLGLEDYSDIAAVKKAFRALALIHHPDKGGQEGAFKTIGHAYFVLSDPRSKAEYDHLLEHGSAESINNYTARSQDDFESDLAALFAQTKMEFAARDDEKTNVKRSSLPVPAFLSIYTAPQIMTRYFYIVGSPINVSKSMGELRDAIPETEIYESFSQLDNITLFEDEYSAFSYASSTRSGDFYKDALCFQSPIAKVKVFLQPDATPYRLDYWINERHENNQDGATKNSGSLYCIDTTIKNVRIISARMLVMTAKRGQFYKEYPMVDFVDKANSTNKPKLL